MRLLLLLMVLAFAAVDAAAQTESQMEAADRFGQALQTYFRSPDPDREVARLASAPPSIFEAEYAPYYLGAFYAHLIDADPRVGEALVETAEAGNEAMAETVINALSYSDHPRRMELVRRLGGNGAVDQMPPAGWNLTKLPMTDPVHVDMLWASFFATGDDVYVALVARTLDHYLTQEEVAALWPPKEDESHVIQKALRASIAHTAVLSFRAIAPNYPEVRAALQRFAATAEGPAAGYAEVILRSLAESGTR